MNSFILNRGALPGVSIPQLTFDCRGGIMDKDKVKGTVDDAVGRAKRQVGEWTGDTDAQVEGAAQQIKGKTEKAWGNVKDAVRDARDEANEEIDKKKQPESVHSVPERKKEHGS